VHPPERAIALRDHLNNSGSPATYITDTAGGSWQSAGGMAPSVGTKPTQFPRVAVGGTFDRLHAGHRLLLAATAVAASSCVYVGITGANSTIATPSTRTLHALRALPPSLHVLCCACAVLCVCCAVRVLGFTHTALMTSVPTPPCARPAGADRVSARCGQPAAPHACAHACWAVRQRLCLRAADELLKHKKHAEMLQPYEEREAATVAFLQAVNPALTITSGSLRDPQVRAPPSPVAKKRMIKPW
jgi:phosphopantetheine adenylyltransferase